MTNLLLDTSVFLWYFWGSGRIDSVKHLIESSENGVFISAASWWEIAVKARAGKLLVDPEQLRHLAKIYAFEELPVTSEHIKVCMDLPRLHKDPFDLMLLAQAITTPMRLITADAFLAEYSSLVMVI